MKAKHLVWLRRISQALFLVLFLFLLVETRFPDSIYLEYSLAVTTEQDIRLHYPSTFFFQLNPLIWLTSLLSGHIWIKGFFWAVGVILLTLLLGRFFCGFVCPLGTLHHMAGRIRPALKGKKMIEANRKRGSQKIKYFLLLTLLISSLMGLNFTGLLDPISLFFRSLALAVFPALGNGIKAICDVIARSDIKPLNLLSYGAEVLVSPVFGYGYQSFKTGWFIGVLFLVILFLNRIRPRFWCRTLCPLGALLAIFSRFSILGLEKNNETCTDCKLCERDCQGAASLHPDQGWDHTECLLCFNCSGGCPENALSFRFKWSHLPSRGPDMGRRAVLGGLMAGISLPLLGRLDGNIHAVSDPRLIRPPGALEEKNFLELCQRCGLCMKVCPTNVINPALTEGGMAAFWTPNLIMTLGYCEYSCILCGSVCPTGAIKEISSKEKIEQPVRIGSAYIVRGRCLPWSGNGPCIVCEEHCPTSPKAIYLRNEVVPRSDGKESEVLLPYVDLKRCVGCGICEYKCPVKGRPAVLVIAAGESRSVRNQILLDMQGGSYAQGGLASPRRERVEQGKPFHRLDRR
ncbi:MAG: 4Fe-4S binding protein [Proteobacteria bacterium]|nr:4Fe-4S binding protein [Pseudomonadota bacterium]